MISPTKGWTRQSQIEHSVHRRAMYALIPKVENADKDGLLFARGRIRTCRPIQLLSCCCSRQRERATLIVAPVNKKTNTSDSEREMLQDSYYVSIVMLRICKAFNKTLKNNGLPLRIFTFGVFKLLTIYSILYSLKEWVKYLRDTSYSWSLSTGVCKT